MALVIADRQSQPKRKLPKFKDSRYVQNGIPTLNQKLKRVKQKKTQTPSLLCSLYAQHQWLPERKIGTMILLSCHSHGGVNLRLTILQHQFYRSLHTPIATNQCRALLRPKIDLNRVFYKPTKDNKLCNHNKKIYRFEFNFMPVI